MPIGKIMNINDRRGWQISFCIYEQVANQKGSGDSIASGRRTGSIAMRYSTIIVALSIATLERPLACHIAINSRMEGLRGCS